jgi:hypothetical protein
MTAKHVEAVQWLCCVIHGWQFPNLKHKWYNWKSTSLTTTKPLREKAYFSQCIIYVRTKKLNEIIS